MTDIRTFSQTVDRKDGGRMVIVTVSAWDVARVLEGMLRDAPAEALPVNIRELIDNLRTSRG